MDGRSELLAQTADCLSSARLAFHHPPPTSSSMQVLQQSFLSTFKSPLSEVTTTDHSRKRSLEEYEEDSSQADDSEDSDAPKGLERFPLGTQIQFEESHQGDGGGGTRKPLKKFVSSSCLQGGTGSSKKRLSLPSWSLDLSFWTGRSQALSLSDSQETLVVSPPPAAAVDESEDSDLPKRDLSSIATDLGRPRRQSLRFEGDLYTPRWVRFEKTKKEGLCDLCPKPGKWLLLKNSTFWYVSPPFLYVSL